MWLQSTGEHHLLNPKYASDSYRMGCHEYLLEQLEKKFFSVTNMCTLLMEECGLPMGVFISCLVTAARISVACLRQTLAPGVRPQLQQPY